MAQNDRLTRRAVICRGLSKAFFSIYSYTIIYALFGVLSSSYHACFNSSLSTLEKRYHFSSSTGGLIMITDNIATVLTNLFIGYYGKTAHKPRWMSIGCVVTGFSVMVSALPYFIYGAANDDDLDFVSSINKTWVSKIRDGHQLCYDQPQTEDCNQMSAGKTMTIVAVGCFAISNFFRGFGTSIYFTYGTPYLDDNVSKAKMPTFFAFIFAARICGAPIGYLLSSTALKYYENPFSAPPDLKLTDPRWIGAWWIGFLVTGCLLLVLAIPLSLFPREFKKKPTKTDLAIIELNTNGLSTSDHNNIQNNATSSGSLKLSTDTGNNNTNKHNNDYDHDKSSGDTLDLKKLPSEIYEIITNPIVACQMMGNLFRGIGIIGYFVFQTKYLESQFRQSASKASLVSGTTGFLAKTTGVLFGGLLITLCRPGPRALTTFLFIVELTSIFTLMYGAAVIGPQLEFPHTSLNEHNELELNNQCNKNCSCDYVRYQPVCEHLDNKAYFSPCHAGCKQAMPTLDNNTHFIDCSCSDSPALEVCKPDTERLLRYVTIVALGGMISGSSRSGNMVTFFRSIRPDQKSLAVAVGSFWHSLFVAIPYPILYGKIFDYCCLHWSTECGKRGNCWLYDTEKLRYLYHAVSISLIALGSVFDFIMIFLSGRLTNLYDDDGKKGLYERIKTMFARKKRTQSSGPIIQIPSLDLDMHKNTQANAARS